VAAPVGFVGRERELAVLRRALGSDAPLLLVVGDAGVGKTRFVGEGMRQATARGMVSAWGGCLPLAEKLPLLPVADALGELSRIEDGALLANALDATPNYVRAEIERLLPQLGSSATTTQRYDSGQRERLFAAVAELLSAVARRSPACLVIEDVHWADAATLDCLTFLARAHGVAAPTVVVTCRGDEAPLDPQVAEWMAHAAGTGAVEEIRLGPLSRREVAEQVAGLVGEPPTTRVTDELHSRAEGNPFFIEQLVAAASSAGSGLLSTNLPARLAELLAARVRRCDDDAREVLTALAIAGRPLSEQLLCEVSGLDMSVVRRRLRSLAAARLLAEPTVSGEQRPRHALLAEAVAAELLPGERSVLHERTARALEAANDDTLAAEAAGHWAAAGRIADELPARVRAAETAERVFGYAEAARHWQRAIELFQAQPDAERLVHIDLPRLYLRAIDALHAVGDGRRGHVLAEEAYRRFASDPDPAIAAVVHLRVSWSRWERNPAALLALIEDALRLFDQAPPSADQAEAWYSYASAFFFLAEGQGGDRLAALERALEIAEAEGATALIARIQVGLARDAFLRGQVVEGFAMLGRARALAEATEDASSLIDLACAESDVLLKAGSFGEAAEVALRGMQTASETGRKASIDANIAISNAAEALLAQGRTAEAAELVDPLTNGPADLDHFPLHGLRSEIDLLRGNIAGAADRQQQIRIAAGHIASLDNAREVAQRAAEIALWAGRPENGLAEVRETIARYPVSDLTILCGWLLVLGMRACADLAGQGRARRDESATPAALAAAADLGAWVDRMGGAPFADHPFVATIPAERATWYAERSRLAGASDPAAWHAAAKTWEDLGCPHRAGYAWWRHAEARLLAGQPSTAAAVSLRAAAAAADGHLPLLAAIHALAERAHIPLGTAPVTVDGPQPRTEATPYGLTERELLVLRLLAAGRTNPQIGAELFISPKTASVHVTNILRKLGVSTRVQAAALAERAGLLGRS
jgi:DNA-binding CsgD family transcriptional regulator/tetratricopeptide (TPR) repeat protein